MKELTHLSLFSGVGGLDLAAERAGFRTAGQCEWADYPHSILTKHWPDVPKWRDIRTLTQEDFYAKTGQKTVTIISGGFPCQPFSQAGKRRGQADDRYLWPEMLRVIRDIRPTWVLGENVAGIVNMALDQVLSDLEAEGYTTGALLFPAYAVDAPHRRDRTAILAHAGSVGHLHREAVVNYPQAWRETRLYAGPGWKRVAGQALPWADTAGDGRQDTWPAEPGVCRVADGLPNQLDRIAALGNAVVPAQFYPIFQAIADIENMTI
ncbi:MAG: DNA cytosine methyltransferase [Ruminococcaceae bacterium]|nr:DNA cytosine methyltransferase [Oscillospiraceae bacterium]